MFHKRKFFISLVLLSLFQNCLATPHHQHETKQLHTKHKIAIVKPVKIKKHPLVQRHSKILPAHIEKSPNLSLNDLTESRSISFVSSMTERLVNFIRTSIDRLHYSVYKLGGNHFDPSRGIYIVDCSSYVDYSLQAVYPNAYLSLVNSTGANKPNSIHYYDFFRGLENDPNKYWGKVNVIDQLQPGDILVFRYKNNNRSGHVMIVMNKPERRGDVYLVSVADSAPAGHSEDTRLHTSGVGIGTLLLKANPVTGEPYAFAWKVGSRWEKNVKFAMARPLENKSYYNNNFNWATEARDFT